MEQETYDVTGVTDQREYVPIAADVARLKDAEDIARVRSADRSMIPWSAVQVKVARTRQVKATYVNGERQPS